MFLYLSLLRTERGLGICIVEKFYLRLFWFENFRNSGERIFCCIFIYLGVFKLLKFLWVLIYLFEN